LLLTAAPALHSHVFRKRMKWGFSARSPGKGTRQSRRGTSEGANALRKHSELPEDERDAHSESVQAEQKGSS
jgi:hypothetical protein